MRKNILFSKESMKIDLNQSQFKENKKISAQHKDVSVYVKMEKDVSILHIL